MDVARRQIHQVGIVTQDAVVSGAWLYPIYASMMGGLVYLISHPKLLKPLIPTIINGLLMSLGVIAAIFVFTYLPQVAFLALVSGPLAFVAAIPLLLGESYVIINYLTRTFLFGQAGTDLFDAVLVQKGHSSLVEKGRQITTSGGKRQVLGKLVGGPLSKFNTDSIIRYLLTLPLNLVPVVGTAFFLGFNGYKSGPGCHARYFQLKGFDPQRRQAAVSKRRGAYTAFGTVAMLLNLLPAVSILFNFSNAVGAALWASDIESKGKPSADTSEAVMPAKP